MPAGRPSEYKPEYCEKVDEYLALNQDEEYEFHKTRGDKSDSFEEKIKVKLPTIEGFADFLGVMKKTLYNWADEHEEFLHSLEKIKDEQKKRLLEKGLSGTYNPVIAKLVLSANHGMIEKTAQDITSKGERLGVIVLPQRNENTLGTPGKTEDSTG